MVNHGPDHVPPRFLMADNQIPWSTIKNQGDHGLPWSSFRLGTLRDFLPADCAISTPLLPLVSTDYRRPLSGLRSFKAGC
ncbi:hypothetical protein DPMN_020167 [Dreissena polymorpha]|uniref:Uncharacterized protein n=1 Tax=Dreissena polymorpha TaxID=45954 RepID=A0A9D4SAT5_DREPO|nr:hypothetical protein DPMN_020167 [Dreissena polymorpha]